MHILLVEPDRVVAKCIVEAFQSENATFSIATTADGAVIQADTKKPDLVITELMLAGHSGSEFLYEFRTYSDWESTPIIVYTSLQIPPNITNASDWKNLYVSEVVYKPKSSIEDLKHVAFDVLETKAQHAKS